MTAAGPGDARALCDANFMLAAERMTVPQLLDEVRGLLAQLAEERAEVERLQVRQQELLATIVRVTNETPFPDEIKGWQAQRSAMTAEIGTLRSALREATDDTAEQIADWVGGQDLVEIGFSWELARQIRSGAWRKP